jgi:glutaredoxin 3
MPEVTVYTTDPCPYCARVKQLLRARDIEFTEINMARDAAGRAELVQRTGMMTFPQVLIGDEVIGGFDDTRAADRSGRLRELLAAA